MDLLDGTIVQQVHATNVKFVLVSRMEDAVGTVRSGSFHGAADTERVWVLAVMREGSSDVFSKTFLAADRTALLTKNIEHKTWASYASHFISGVKEGEIYIPNDSTTTGPLILKVHPGAVSLWSLSFNPVLNTLSPSPKILQRQMQRAHPYEHLRMQGPSMVVVQELDTLKRERDYWKSAASAAVVATSALNPNAKRWKGRKEANSGKKSPKSSRQSV
ncbi:hypothetical protein BC829DRAFT_412750 [Chytridium lagenaria]|nr:hypothetical protein BC829DRAFT_412750 [Chytridium lagenaria]